jgi:aminoglycoside 6'-N-acetyltransferase
MPQSATALASRPLVDGDLFRVRRWLAEPHVIENWGTRAAADAALSLAADSQDAVLRIITRNDEAIGYAQALDLDDPLLPRGCWQADLFIGAKPMADQEIEACGSALFRDELFRSTLATAIVFRVPVQNEVRIRALEQRKFRWLHVEQSPGTPGPFWLMISER